MRVGLPLLICFVIGVALVVQFFIPHGISRDAMERGSRWLIIISAFALVLGIGSLVKTHLDKIRRRSRDWGYSVVAIAGLVITSAVGLRYGVAEKSPTYWIFQNMVVPLEATMFSLLAFFIASAAYRTFRARTPEATVLLVAAVVVMLGQVPIGGLISKHLPELKEWLLTGPTTAAKRGIGFGICLGVIATSLRIILGIERSYLGGE
ncbi:MAG: hypothetical protein ACE5O2_07285 [Armatimonadota bacterium]